MSRRFAPALLFAFFVASTSVSAQTQAGAPAIPDTPAGSILRAWLDAFNSGDTIRMDAYYRQYQPDRRARDEIGFRNEVGGFDLVSIERSEPRHVEFVVKERKGDRTAYGVIEVSETEPRKVTDSPLLALGMSGFSLAESVLTTLHQVYFQPAC